MIYGCVEETGEQRGQREGAAAGARALVRTKSRHAESVRAAGAFRHDDLFVLTCVRSLSVPYLVLLSRASQEARPLSRSHCMDAPFITQYSVNISRHVGVCAPGATEKER